MYNVKKRYVQDPLGSSQRKHLLSGLDCFSSAKSTVFSKPSLKRALPCLHGLSLAQQQRVQQRVTVALQQRVTVALQLPGKLDLKKQHTPSCLATMATLFATDLRVGQSLILRFLVVIKICW